jgi:pimeloyl-ACP methyl ester carboxylesterase
LDAPGPGPIQGLPWGLPGPAGFDIVPLIHAGIPGSRLLLLEHSGHMGHIEEPAAFASGIRAFLKSLPERTP